VLGGKILDLSPDVKLHGFESKASNSSRYTNERYRSPSWTHIASGHGTAVFPPESVDWVRTSSYLSIDGCGRDVYSVQMTRYVKRNLIDLSICQELVEDWEIFVLANLKAERSARGLVVAKAAFNKASFFFNEAVE
jgi:hypothetical protein